MTGVDGGVVFLNGTLIDGTGRDPARAFVRVEGERIAEVQPMAQHGRSQGGGRAIDLDGRIIMPGLIDCHVHHIYGGFRNLMEIDGSPIELATIRAMMNARTFLEAGYTSVRDVGTRGNIAAALRDAVKAGWIPGPRIVASGRVLSTTAGLADSYPNWMENHAGMGLLVDGPHEFARAVRRQVKDGVDNIKIAGSGAEASIFATTWMVTMRLDEMQAVVHEAHAFGKTVACHTQSHGSAKYAVQAGVDTIEHGTRMDEETIDLLTRSPTYLVPTLCTLYSVLERGEKMGVLPKQIEEMKVNEPLWKASFRAAYEAGVKIAAGSDIGNRYPQGENARELELMVLNGMKPMDAILSATRVAAEAIKLSGVGTLEPGKLADLIVVDGDPLEDIRVLQDHGRLHHIMRGGRFYKDEANLRTAEIPQV
ncbi:MAG: amidohydrolase family protein [Armatimonadetes bacterium]|nr:amidohydrolase family protein [Armatimonadota bacterium]